jgi:hypothetical protein
MHRRELTLHRLTPLETESAQPDTQPQTHPAAVNYRGTEGAHRRARAVATA